MEAIINLKELQRLQESKLREIMAPMEFSSKQDALGLANQKLESISKEYDISINHLLHAAESNQLPFNVAFEVLSLLSEVRCFSK